MILTGWKAVIKLAAEKSGWGNKKGVSRDSVFIFHISLMWHRFVKWRWKTGKPVVKKIYAVSDCGEVINLSGARQQVMGGIVDGLWTCDVW